MHFDSEFQIVLRHFRVIFGGLWFLLLQTVPPNIRKRLIRERLPQTVHASCGLLLMVSQSAQNTELSRGTALKPPSVWAPAFISEPLNKEMLTRQVRFPFLIRIVPDCITRHEAGDAAQSTFPKEFS